MKLEAAPAPDGSGGMFDRIAARYDLVNRVISLGADASWRRRTVAALELESGARVLDLATGTAELALAVARSSPQVEVLGIDPSAAMLERGRSKIARAGLGARVELRCGDAQALELPDASVDAVCMAFGIRNVPDRGRALREIRRVLRPDGRCAILELTEPRGWLGPVARFHVHRVVPWIGSAISGGGEYAYLERSIAAFPAPSAFAEQLRDAGLEVILVEPLALGAVHLFIGAAPSASSQR